MHGEFYILDQNSNVNIFTGGFSRDTDRFNGTYDLIVTSFICYEIQILKLTRSIRVGVQAQLI